MTRFSGRIFRSRGTYSDASALSTFGTHAQLWPSLQRRFPPTAPREPRITVGGQVKRLRLAILGAVFALSACATAPGPSTQPSVPAIVPPSAPNPEADAKFSAFVRDFRATAIAAGVSPQTYDIAMANITRNSRVEQLNLQQPEFTTPVWTYLDGMVSDARVSKGRENLTNESPTLTAIENTFGVPRTILVAIWGDETNYGETMGSFNMFEALATLAYDGPRAEYARRELIAALKVMEKEHYRPADMTSSWAGAFGQTQFVPSTFLAHAIDGDADGTIDLWKSPADALASAASVLADAGWKRGSVWAYEIQLPQGFDYSNADLDVSKPLTSWQALGVKTVSGSELSVGDGLASIYLPAGARGPAFLVFDNFKTILKYNNATSYVLAICTLADRLQGGGGIVTAWPRDEMPLTADERTTLQTTLKSLGFDPGVIDGVLGRGTRAAIRTYQQARGLTADGYPTKELLARLMEEANNATVKN